MVVYSYSTAWGVKISIKHLREKFRNNDEFNNLLNDYYSPLIEKFFEEKFSVYCKNIPHDYFVDDDETSDDVKHDFDDDETSVDVKHDFDDYFFFGKKVTDCDVDDDETSVDVKHDFDDETSDDVKHDFDDDYFFFGKKVTDCEIEDPILQKTFDFISKEDMDNYYNEAVDIIKNLGFDVKDITYATISNGCACCR